MATLKLIDVTKKFGEVIAVNKLNLEVNHGECFSFLGPSGCGKTTTLRMIAGFEDLDKGELSVDGEIYSSSITKKYIPPEQRNFGMVFQAFAVWPHITVWENVAFPLKIGKYAKEEIKTRVQDALKVTGLEKEADLYPGKLSGGQQQRIALARAVAINPKVMLLDEPLSNLDPHLREEMRFEIKELQKKFQFTIIYVTHDQAEAMALSDRILVMKNGVVQQIDTPLNIYNKPKNSFVFSFIGLSNFIPVDIEQGSISIRNAKEAGIIHAKQIPEDKSKLYNLACRPGEIDFIPDSEDGISGIVTRRTYLGSIVDYLVRVGDVDIRIQKPRHKSIARENEKCKIKFNNVLWYERDAE
ncbi:ABC transporter ATP-binding protein [Treponema phagedenis]|uniref:ABC transporter ATP-binding protein n=1 Tax=Treponema phagedenis TaxID=162 RepID=A0A0B7GWJ0_TREPH|nr:ABC transporter ATP-binding protein [Treponema phagedenis]NVP24074.1 ABC transporter ATP-binding protein [Treponema phagedenis]QEJ96218.1 ABC transporter ATP-binding protein [Treponema phagedenis]QEJ99358.1 ABC transporter ATP-binding protein [Treponema phagedenis]QEJ99993.1 ABC transporter ATP-binding protein [Treponema phagedenis]QEK04929.1 ABC transporter ATP-binding protein [Treponema phagedenis]